MEDVKDYKNTLNLPVTSFPMKANLSQREPEILATWEAMGLYRRQRVQAQGREKFILHDGPPYANGNIHLGTALNKILKDIIVKSKFMQGYDSVYVPGWDCHGLPIEHNVDKMLGDRKEGLGIVAVREECRRYAQKYVEVQREEFKRLGVLADWENPYLTMHPGYVAQIVREFGAFVRRGSVYRGKKPIYWCASCRTALAEAEVEYSDHSSPSIYVRFPLVSPVPACLGGVPMGKAAVLIWTTTPWTIPANLAIALHPDSLYTVIQTPQGDYLIVADERLPFLAAELSLGGYKKIADCLGKDLEGLQCRHPLYDRASLLILGTHVTMEQGTGCVHTAPGHGQEDYEVGLRYGLEVFAPVDDEGRFTREAAPFDGMFVFDANEAVNKLLRERGALLKQETITHSYPHCWRCKNPVIFRATEQWFISMEVNDLRSRALSHIEKVEWIPKWGKDRIYNMIKHRPDWCISRQRAWGVPIVAFFCTECGEVLLDTSVIDSIADRFEKEGADVWFSSSPSELLPAGATCARCGGDSFRKDGNILDVWFDSGVSFASVLEKRVDLHFPADLYLEGSDQHRGWFHSSLLAAVATRGVAPYRSVLTHGFVVDGEGRKMSKSLGNITHPMDIIQRYGVEILRMWAASEDYRDDIRISDEILSRLSESYRKIRNTSRFLLGNLFDFDPHSDMVPFPGREEIDRWACLRLEKLVEDVSASYRAYDFHMIYHHLLEFCIVDLSSFYLDVLKEVLYISSPRSLKRRSAQSTLYEIVHTLSRLIAPILSFTAEDIWRHIPGATAAAESVHLCAFPSLDAARKDRDLEDRWAKILKVRSVVSKALEAARKNKVIGHSLDARVTIEAPGEWYEFLVSFPCELRLVFIVSEAVITIARGGNAPGGAEGKEIPGLRVLVERAQGEKCARCWVYSRSVGENREHPGICARCVSELEARAKERGDG